MQHAAYLPTPEGRAVVLPVGRGGSARRGDAYRVVYAVRIGADLCVVHAFQKKSRTDIKTPVQKINLVRQRLKRLKETLQ